MMQPTAAMIVIGDEILSGRTRDINANTIATRLTAAGFELCEVRFISDKPHAIIEAVNALRDEYEHVFTSGGIGPTHDDITADCVAEAFGVDIGVRADARAILEAHYANTDKELNEARLRMARIPDTATLIENPVSKAPGFSLGNVHVMAGVPKIFNAMLDGLLPSLAGGQPLLSSTVRVERPEGEVAGSLAGFAADNPDLAIGSYPFDTNGTLGCNIVVRGPEKITVTAAAATLALLLRGEISSA